jgi:hypothetical protein
MKIRLFLALAVGVLILMVWRYLLPQPPRDACVVDQERTIEDMLIARDQGEGMIPKGFVVEQRPIKWRASDQAKLFILPSRKAKSTSLGAGFSGIAICRVKDMDGNWWIVNGRDRGGLLSYVPENDAVTSGGL